jgi:hypothetical protein
VERTGEVDVDEPLPRFDGHLDERRPVHQARAGDQDVHRPQLTADLGERLLDRGSVRDVRGHAERGHPLGAQFFGDPLRRISVEVEHRDPVAAPSEFVTRRLPHARRTAGHHRHPCHVLPRSYS